MSKPIDTLARQHAERAIEVIATIMDDPIYDAKDRLKAAEQLLDRAHGKPKDAIIHAPLTKAQALLVAALTDDQLLAAIKAAPLPRLAAPIDAEFEDVTPARDPLLD